jgi:hypothetical protein
MELPVPSIDELVVMSPAEVEAVLRGLDEVRRSAEAAVATFVGRAELAGLHRVDGHRTPRAFGMAACNWSWADAGRVVQVANMLAVWPSALGVGVAQLQALAGWRRTRGCGRSWPMPRSWWWGGRARWRSTISSLL